MKLLRRHLRLILGAALIAALGIAVWWLPPSGSQRARAWWQNLTDHTTPVATTFNGAVSRPLDDLPVELRNRVAQALQDPAAALRRFDSWQRHFENTPEGPSRDELLPEGVAAAQERREVLFEVIAVDPALALRLAVSRRARAQLPADIVAELEEPLSGRGDFHVLAALPDETPDANLRAVRREAVLDGQTYEAFVYGRRSRLATNQGIALHGIAIDGRLALLDSPVRVLEAGEVPADGRVVDELCVVSGLPAGPWQAANDEPVIGADVGTRVYYLCSAGHIALLEEKLFAQENGGGTGAATTAAAANASTTGAKRVLYIRVRFAGDAAGSEPQSEASALTMFAEADAFLRENSFEALSISPTVTPVYTLPQTADWYRANDGSGYALNILQAARAVAKDPTASAGNDNLPAFDYLTYDFEAVRYSGGPGTFSGQGYVGLRGAWIKSSSAGVLVHELGHNLGLWHANYWEPSNAEALTGAGQNREYGDVFDTMGSLHLGPRHFNVIEKAHLGWLPNDTVETAFVSGTYRIFAHDLGGTIDLDRRYGLRVPRDNDRTFGFEFRQHAGWAQNLALLNGLGVRWDTWTSSNGGTQLLDTTGGSPDGKNDSAIAIGRTFSDPIADIHVTPLRKNGTAPESLEVDVQIGPFPGNRAPVVTMSATAAVVALHVPVTFTANAADPDGNALAYAWEVGAASISSNTPTLLHTWTQAGDYRVRVTVSDRKGGTTSTSLLVRVGTPTGARVRGVVTDLAGVPVAGVRVATALGLGDVNHREALTDVDGSFALTDVASGAWVLNATKPGWTFAPLTFVNPLPVTGDRTGIDFTGRAIGWRVTGIVRYADGSPVAGALVSDGTRTEPTDASGAFALVGVPLGRHLLQITHPSAQFPVTAVEVAYGDTIVPTITEITFTLAGEITGANGLTATVTDGWRTTTSIMVGEGSNTRNTFALVGVPAGAWHLHALLGEELLSPVTFVNPVAVVGPRTNLVFARETEDATSGAIIRGFVTHRGAGIAGATVQAGTYSATTDDRGAYALMGLPRGVHTLAVTAPGRVFAPASRTVDVTTSLVDGINFASVQNNAPPTFAQTARTVGILRGPFRSLSTRAEDDGGEARLIYTWSVVGTAPGTVEFSVNGAHSAAATVARFSAAGPYRLRVTVTDAEGASASSEVTVTVTAVPVQMTISPGTTATVAGGLTTFTVACIDQFGGAVAPTAVVRWSVSEGGTISSAGVFAGVTPGRDYVVTARMDDLVATGRIDVGHAHGPGYGLTHALWTGLMGTQMRTLTDLAKFPDQPDYTSEWEGPLESAIGESSEVSFGRRLRGFFVPPATGTYIFSIASSNASELWLSAGSNPAGRVLIASVPVATGFRQWNAVPSQRSAAVQLTQGEPVYLEFLHKADHTGGHHFSVGVELPGGVFEGPIPAHRLLPWGASAFAPPRIVLPAQATPSIVGAELAAQLSVVATSDGGEGALTYNWRATGVAPGPVAFLPNGTNSAKQCTVRFAQTGRYNLLVTVTDAAFQSITSSVVVDVSETITSWQRRHFTATELDDPAQHDTRWGPDADPDGDGVANLLEYAFDLNPLAPDAAGQPQPTFVTENGVEYLAITFRRNPAATDIVFTPQATSDLRTWEVGLIAVGDTQGPEVTYRDFAPAQSFDKRFLRIEVTGP